MTNKLKYSECNLFFIRQGTGFLTEVLNEFPQSVQVNGGLVPPSRERQLPYRFLPT